MDERQEAAGHGWLSLVRAEWLPALAVLLGGVLLHSMNVLLLATVLPTIVGELGGAALMSWPTTAFLASSIVAATCTGLLTAVVGARPTFCGGALVFGAGALICALAPHMAWVIAGRFVQGFGGGLLTAVAYVLVRNTFPPAAWSRVLALLSGMWSVSILVGPLAGGAFARQGDWRNVFFMVAAIAAILAIGAFLTLPASQSNSRGAVPRVPLARVGLICGAIAGTSLAAVLSQPQAKAIVIALAIGALVAMVRADRLATTSLLPRDAFSLSSLTGTGLWLVLLLSIGYSPLQIYVPIFLQKLHGLDPLAAGYAVAGASIGWTGAAVIVAGTKDERADRLIVLGPALMVAGLGLAAWSMPSQPLAVVIGAILTVGAGIGICWAFVAQRVMSGARHEDETVAASSVATVQQMGFAVGAALAGLAANASGFGDGLEKQGVIDAAVWVPASFTAAAVLAWLAAFRLRALRRSLSS